jgi:hypothetical protein
VVLPGSGFTVDLKRCKKKTRLQKAARIRIQPGYNSLYDFAQGGIDPAELEDLGRSIHQGKPDPPLRGPHLAHPVVRPQLLHLVASGCGKVLDDEAVEAVRTGAPRGGKGLLLEEEDRSPEGLVGQSEDEGRGVRNPLFVLYCIHTVCERGGIGGLRQINKTPSAKYFTGTFLIKADI